MKMISKKLWLATLMVSGVSNCMYAEYDAINFKQVDKEGKRLSDEVLLWDKSDPGNSYVLKQESGEYYYQPVLDNNKEVDKKLKKRQKKAAKQSKSFSKKHGERAVAESSSNE